MTALTLIITHQLVDIQTVSGIHLQNRFWKTCHRLNFARHLRNWWPVNPQNMLNVSKLALVRRSVERCSMVIFLTFKRNLLAEMGWMGWIGKPYKNFMTILELSLVGCLFPLLIDNILLFRWKTWSFFDGFLGSFWFFWRFF